MVNVTIYIINMRNQQIDLGNFQVSVPAQKDGLRIFSVFISSLTLAPDKLAV